MSDLRGRTFLVTGATSGIGKFTARALSLRGGAVVLGSLSRELALPVVEEIRRATPDADVEILDFDLSSLGAVRAAAERFLASGRPLDVLVNNAGISAVPGVSRDGFELAFATNHLGPFLFTSLLLPKLMQSPSARIVNVSSDAHRGARQIDWSMLERATTGVPEQLKMYSLTKLMNILHAKELARRLQGTSVSAYALHPGTVASGIWREASRPVRAVMNWLMLSEEEGAQTSIWCATAPELEGVSGQYYRKRKAQRPSRLAEDAGLAAELWARSTEMVRRVVGNFES